MSTARQRTSLEHVFIPIDHVEEENKKIIDGNNRKLKFLYFVSFVLVVSSGQFITLMKHVYNTLPLENTCEAADSDRVHNYPVTELMPNISCRIKSTGVSKGKICDFDQETYYLKVLPCTYLKHSSQLISYEEANRVFSLKNINVTVPITRFFKEQDSKTFYIGSKQIENYLPGTSKEAQNKLTQEEKAKLIVASTFFKDLIYNKKNWGYGKEGLVLIDVDSAFNYFKISKTTRDYLEVAIESLENLKLSFLTLDVLKEMKKIYIQMQKKPFPEFFDSFDQSYETYLEVLKIYIDCCDKAIKKVELHPAPSSSSSLFSFLRPQNRYVQDVLRIELRSALINVNRSFKKIK